MKKSKIVWALYIVAALLGVLFLIMLITSISYISNYAASYGVSIGELGSEAIGYIFSNSVSYLIYGILVFASARVLDVLEAIRRGQADGEAAKGIGAGYVPAESAKAEAALAGAAAGAAVAGAAEAVAEAAEEADAVAEAADVMPAKGPVPPLYTERSIFRY